jgi:hypothetical protein
METDYSSDGLLTFLREAALAGRMTPAVARTRRAAAEALFEKLTATEAEDLRNLELDALMARFLDIHGSGLRSEVVQLYGERLYDALDDYFRFLRAPEEFKSRRPRALTTPRRSGDSGDSGDNADAEETRALEAVRLSAPTQRPDVMPVQLGEGRVVYLHGIPPDLTTAEARKLARVIEALADDEERAG